MSDLGQYEDHEKKIQTASLSLAKKAFGLPKDIAFFRTLDSEFKEDLDACNAKILGLANKLLDVAHGVDQIKSKAKGKERVPLGNVDEVSDRFGSDVVSTLEPLLEKTDMYLDAYSNHASTSEFKIQVQTPATPKKPKAAIPADILHASTLPKPQLKFKRKPDNSLDTPWIPPIHQKPNAQVPLDEEFTSPRNLPASFQFPHPYRHEIAHISYPENLLQKSEPILYRSFEETPVHWVATPEDLKSLLHDLKMVNEFAVDLEHHDYRSYGGFLCLMQISTRESDYIVDTLLLREELQILNEVFTDSMITKVFHGAESDIVWLQQNFGLYVVNLFDTYHASNVLELPKHSLAHLLSIYCNFTADKRYQLADWRIRPLPQEMFDYARSDTHFLLYIYDRMRNLLLEHAEGRGNSVEIVLRKSEETCLRTYQKELYDPTGSGKNGWFNLIQKWHTSLNDLQLLIFKAIHQWRDQVAREEDESTRFILANNLLFSLAVQQPADIKSLSKLLKRPSRPLQSRLPILLATVRKSLHSGLTVDSSSAQKEVSQNPVQPVTNSVAAIDTQEAPTPAHLSSPVQLDPSYLQTSSSKLLAMNVIEQQAVPIGFANILHEIHNLMRVVPSVPQPAPISSSASLLAGQQATADHAAVNIPDLQPKKLDLTFVPAAQRGTARVELQDQIVVVGKPGKRKRKRNQATEVKNMETSSLGAPSRGEGDPVADGPTPFDYDASDNILDARDDSEAERPAKRKAKKKESFGYGAFPAPPRNLSEMKSGNIARSFK